MTGKVFLIGAGPGDIELLTLKAARILQSADVVLHDALVGEDILEMARPHALLVDVGKRVGDKRISQDAINRMLVQFAASAGVVVRLKGGDPLIFGRAAEEMAALRHAGVEFEIVPGITAAIAAAAQAQISLTDRQSASAVTFLTAQQARGKKPTEMAAFANSGATLAIYMPGGQYEDISRQLLSAGVAKETPCLIVSNATRPQQQSHWTDLASLASLSQTETPALLIIGEVAKGTEESLAKTISALPVEFTEAESRVKGRSFD